MSLQWAHGAVSRGSKHQAGRDGGLCVPAGRVSGGGDRAQAGLDVQLKDEKGMVKGTAKSNDKGEFSFENVPPGPYKVSSMKKESKTKGEAAVTVEVDKTKEVTVKLLR